MPWSDFTKADAFRKASPEVRVIVKKKYFEDQMLQKVQEKVSDPSAREQVYAVFMETPNDTGEPLPVSIVGQTIQTFCKPIHLPLTALSELIDNETLSGWGKSIRDTAYIQTPVNEIHRDSFLVRYVGTGLGCFLWVLLGYVLTRSFNAFRAAKQRATLGPRLTELQAFEMAAADLNHGQRHEGLWSKCFSQSDGNEQKTRAAYLKLRAAQIRAQDAVRPYTGDSTADAPVPIPSFVSRNAKTIIIALALALTTASLIAPPVEFKKTVSKRIETYVEHRYLWDMEPRTLPPKYGVSVVNEYSGIELSRLALQLVGIAVLTAGLLAITARLKTP